MASPPRTATSPPYPIHASLPNPKKRGPTLQLGIGHAPKRHKPSARSISGSATSSAHPLRQTSFPPEGLSTSPPARSPSIASSRTGTTATAATTKKPRAKPAKKTPRSSTQSVKSSGTGKTPPKSAPTTASRNPRRTSAPPTTAAAPDDNSVPSDEDDDDDDDAAATATSPAHDDPNQKADREKLALLVDAFDAEQSARYAMFRRVKFRKETVRKITNFVVSQSVPPSVVLTVNGFAKTFVGVLIERARRVQAEWAAAGAAARKRRGEREVLEVDPTDFGMGADPARLVLEAGRGGEGEEGLEHLGPLMPEHLREALRRYKRDGEGGGTGLAGVSVGLGVQGAGSARLQGKRLFR